MGDRPPIAASLAPGDRHVDLDVAVLAGNDRDAQRNRAWLAAHRVLALNLLSSPGSGKTTLLERTLRDLRGEFSMGVIEGDQETTLDADRIRATGCAALQINTGTGCHLEARMIGAALQQLAPPDRSIVMIENVGNLVCPALFDLGEHAKVLLIAVTEGDDKPLKYPHMFRAANLVLVNKVDLLPYVAFDVARCIANARRLNPGVEAIEMSAATGAGMDQWYGWLRRAVPSAT